MKTIDWNYVRTGWEIECLVPLTNNQKYNVFKKFGEISGDGSIDKLSKKHTKFNRLEIGVNHLPFLQAHNHTGVFHALKRAGAITNPSCGFHFHVSYNNANDIMGVEEFASFVSILEKRFREFTTFGCRDEYCKMDHHDTSKYLPVRVVDSYLRRFEIRVFNGSLDIRAFQNNLKQIKNAMDSAMIELRGGNA